MLNTRFRSHGAVGLFNEKSSMVFRLKKKKKVSPGEGAFENALNHGDRQTSGKSSYPH